MSDDNYFYLGVAFVCAIVLVLGAAVSASATQDRFHKEAVARGYAEYYIDLQTEDVEWRWK